MAAPTHLALYVVTAAGAVSLACAGVGSPTPDPVQVESSAKTEITENKSAKGTKKTWIQVLAHDPPGRRLADETDILCQPEVFVPGENVIVDDPTRSDFDKLAQDRASDRWRGVHQSDWTAQLAVPDGVTVTRWRFECDPNPSFSDEVLEFRQEGVRKALFTHIHAMSASPDGSRLYFVNLVRVGGQWVRKARVLDMATLKSAELTPAGCNAYGHAQWLDGTFITSTGYSEWASDGHLCLWTNAGEMVRHIRHRHSMMGMGAPQTYPGTPTFVLVGSVEECQLAAVDLQSGSIRVERRRAGPEDMGVLDCVAMPDTFDAAAFQRFGQPLDVEAGEVP